MRSINSALHSPKKSMIDPHEVDELSRKYGAPIRRTFEMRTTDFDLIDRWRYDPDRRAEVVFAIQGPDERIWLHTKHNYPRPIFRLLSGGVEWHECVEDALLREVDEETGLPVEVQRFVALLDYRFHSAEIVVRFASYLFLLRNRNGTPHPAGNEEIAEFRAILPGQLPQIAADLRNIIGERRDWGRWRAVAHDVLHEAMVQGGIKD